MPLGVYPRSEKTKAERLAILSRVGVLTKEKTKGQVFRRYDRRYYKIRKEVMLQAWTEFREGKLKTE